jgi:sulfhydrogenase subunit beta (sulfur reductase)
MESAVVLPDWRAVDALRAALARDRELFEPCLAAGAGERLASHAGAESEWRRVSGREPFAWETPAPLTGAKRFFFPAREALLRWQVEAAGEPAANLSPGADVAATPPNEPAARADTIEETLPDRAPFVLFGVRPCDLTAIAYQDRFFATDLWYRRRRERALLVGVNCLRACAGGFCRDVDAGPFARTGFDLNLTPLADGRVVVEIGSAEGRAALASAAPACEVDADARAAFATAAAAAVASFPARPAITRGIARINAERGTERVGDAEWQALGPSCFACTGCTNLCPTCSCFTVVDERRDGSGERVRYWDSCLLEGFQREASGHHPAPRPGDRVRRFWYHKLSRDFVADCGRLGCVGCGRCDVTCPGSIGALRILGALGSSP